MSHVSISYDISIFWDFRQARTQFLAWDMDGTWNMSFLVSLYASHVDHQGRLVSVQPFMQSLRF
jgi:hypothetical protein